MATRASWNPGIIEAERVEAVYDTSTHPARIVTNQGRAMLKACGNEHHRHALVREWIGTKAAEWLGLKTFEMAIVAYSGMPKIEQGGFLAEKGPAIATRFVEGSSWSGDAEELELIENKADLAGLVVLDTWLRNHDRYDGEQEPPRRNERNVFLQELPGEGLILLAIDHTDCLRKEVGVELSEKKMRSIDLTRDERIYGDFPEFDLYVNASSIRPFCDRLGVIDRVAAATFVDSVPEAWNFTDSLREAVREHLVDRGHFVAQELGKLLEKSARTKGQ